MTDKKYSLAEIYKADRDHLREELRIAKERINYLEIELKLSDAELEKEKTKEER